MRAASLALVALLAAPSGAFLPASRAGPAPGASFASSASSASSLSAVSLPDVSLPSVDVDTSALATFFLEQVIAAGVPALFSLAVIAFAAKSVATARRERDNELGSGPVLQLYDDLYTDSPSSQQSQSSPFGFGGGGGGGPTGPGRRGRGPSSRNLGLPSKEYLKVTRLNDRYDSYGFSLTAATESKARAAARLRSSNFDRALSRSIAAGLTPLTAAEKTDLLRAEQELLSVGGGLVLEMGYLQRKLTSDAIQGSLDRMGVKVGELDADGNVTEYVAAKEDEGIIVDAVVEELEDEEKAGEDGKEPEAEAKAEAKASRPKAKKMDMKSFKKNRALDKELKELSLLGTDLTRLELAFVQSVIEILGPERANGVRAAILGNEDGGTAAAGTLLKSLQERPLKGVLEGLGYGGDGSGAEEGAGKKKRLFVTDFPGDVSASQVKELREEVTAIIRSSQPGDEALVVLQSGGGTVTGYGLAAAQLGRFKKAGLKLTICVEQVAASGGYMMCCVADRIVASPFAVLGSIGVISDVPNVYERLKKEGIEFQTITAGKYKRTVTPTKLVTKEDLKKSKEDIEEILTLFKGFVHENRPSLDIDKVATGETWFGTQALDRGLCDEIGTADDVLVDFVDQGYDVYDIKYAPQPDGPASLLAGLPIGQSDGGGGLIGGAVRWAVRSVAPAAIEAFREEMASMSMEEGSAANRYMMKDPSSSSDSIRAQD
jgi:signal peptide peptidase SppA